ncbi:hypothetical protein [Geobacter sp. DSM 9736]|uniref:hypothetical protein n=1 Tax=Geobacter sp. DSM 9736 TaxID=1277350 RepID=UPI000B50928F|nr:hypothetical protein [Geobacter sp. DSM 9736]SNB48119.1 hypothetical protein SAMN06269301_3615 [Geobacter sp. DSM 9736]
MKTLPDTNHIAGQEQMLLPKEDSNFRTQYVRWTMVIFGALLLFGGVAACMDALYAPDINAALDRVKDLSVRPLAAFRPEPKERALFLSALATVPGALVLLHLFFGRVIARLTGQKLDYVYYAALGASLSFIVWLGYAGLAAPNPFFEDPQNSHDIISATNLQFFLAGSFLYEHFYLYLAAIFPVTALLLFYNDRMNSGSLKAGGNITRLFIYLCCALLLIVIFSINVFKFPYTYENKYDFNAVYYSMVQVYHGIPMLIDNFTNTYGLYPHFLVPVFKITGLNIAVFSGLMALLNVLCYLGIFFILRTCIQNIYILFMCFCSIVYYAHLHFKLVTNFDAIFASQPIRLIPPVLALVLATAYLKNRGRVLYWFSLFALSFGVLWNPEFGSITIFAYFLFLCYTEFLQNAIRKAALPILLHIVRAAFALAVSFSVYSLAVKLLYGQYPQIFDMFNMIKIFSGAGGGMLAMPLLHPWNLIALVYVIGLLWSIVAVTTGTCSSRHALIFLVAVLGTGMFSYYQGRSHNWNLMHSCIYTFILMGIYADTLLRIARREVTAYLPAALILFIISGSLFQLLYDSGRISKLFFEKENRAANLPEQHEILRNANFVRENTMPGEKVLIFVKDYYQGLYHGLSGTAAAFNPGLQDLFYRSDYVNLLKFLIRNGSTKVFFEPRSFEYFDAEIPVVLSTFYEVKKSNGAMMLLARKTGTRAGAVRNDF